MEREPGLKWLFFDLNSYFASVEQQERPELRGKPIAVVPMQTNSTCAIAASYEAKAYGVKTGTMIYEAKKMCPGLICIPARHDVYVDYHNRIIQEVIKHTPINKIWSIDELSSRLPPNKRTLERSAEVSKNIKEGIWQNIGKHISCSIGVAPNSLLAKIASNMQKPNGLTILRQEDLPGPLLALRLTDLTGIGKNMEKRLNRAGISSIEQLWNTSPKQARKIWGGVQGERFWYWLHGYDFDPPETNNVMIGHSRILDPKLRHENEARTMARRLLVKATYRLRRKEYYAGALNLSVRTCAGYRWANEARFPAAHDPFTFLQHLDDLWGGMLTDFIPGPPLRFKKVSVILHHLRKDGQITHDILDSGYKEKIVDLEKREALASALDKLQNKYQKETVWLGTTPKTIGGYVGTKISFSRVPEKEEFWG
ncbi:MAG: DNA polymerase IV [Micavibrio sp.]|nr:MAG: DNA polymerase IV [Micavibrio sp.]